MEMCMCTAMKNISEFEYIFTVPFMKTRQKKRYDNFPASGEILPQIH